MTKEETIEAMARAINKAAPVLCFPATKQGAIEDILKQAQAAYAVIAPIVAENEKLREELAEAGDAVRSMVGITDRLGNKIDEIYREVCGEQALEGKRDDR